jgi:hypothetical protein
VADAKLLAKRGDVPVDAALALGLALAPSKDRLGVEASLSLLRLSDLDGLGPKDRARYRALLRRTFGTRARALGWLPREGDDAEANALRKKLLYAVAREAEDPVLVKQARRLADAWLADRASVPAEVSFAALDVAAHNGDRDLYDRIVEEAQHTQDRTERGRLLALLGEFRDPALAGEALDLVAPPDAADGQPGAPAFDLRESLPILRAQLGRVETRGLAWKFLTARWDGIAERIRSDEGQWLAVAAAALACEPGKRDEVAGFLTPRAEKFEGAPRALARALEQADDCAATRRRNSQKVTVFLTKYGK